MIVLDTNYLIRLLVPSSDEFERVAAWYTTGDLLASTSIAWYEFCCGPVSENQRALVLSLLRGGILPLGEEEAAEGARLFNSTGRVRSLRVDSLIAAATIVAQASLATSNLRDFSKFIPLGLKLL